MGGWRCLRPDAAHVVHLREPPKGELRLRRAAGSSFLQNRIGECYAGTTRSQNRNCKRPKQELQEAKARRCL